MVSPVIAPLILGKDQTGLQPPGLDRLHFTLRPVIRAIFVTAYICLFYAKGWQAFSRKGQVVTIRLCKPHELLQLFSPEVTEQEQPKSIHQGVS